MNFIAENIKYLRQFSALSQQQFANLFNLNRGNIASYENGSAEPNIENLIKISEYFNIDLITIVKHHLAKIDGIEKKLKNDELVIKDIEQRRKKTAPKFPPGLIVLKTLAPDHETDVETLREISHLFSQKYSLLNKVMKNFKQLQEVEQQIIEKSISLENVTKS